VEIRIAGVPNYKKGLNYVKSIREKMLKKKHSVLRPKITKRGLPLLMLDTVPINIRINEPTCLSLSGLPVPNGVVPCWCATEGTRLVLTEGGYALVVWIRAEVKNNRYLLHPKKVEEHNQGPEEERHLLQHVRQPLALFTAPRFATVAGEHLATELTFHRAPSEATGKYQSQLYLFVSLYDNGRKVAGSVEVPLHFHDTRHRTVTVVAEETISDFETNYVRIYLRYAKPSLSHPFLKVHPHVLGCDPAKIFKTGHPVTVSINPKNGEVVGKIGE
jgi:hypothetical protein